VLGSGTVVGCRGEKGGAGSAQADRAEEKEGRWQTSSCLAASEIGPGERKSVEKKKMGLTKLK
jgi:hypothetical protein